MRNFRELLEERWRKELFVCVGLDSKYNLIPDHLKKGMTVSEAITNFNLAIIHATREVAAAYKLNLGFYLAKGAEGIAALDRTMGHLAEIAPKIPIILDGKFGDIDHSNDGYFQFAFECCDFDAVTLQPYLGRQSLKAHLSRAEKYFFVLCRTSNPGSGEFQDLEIVVPSARRESPPRLYQEVARSVLRLWNQNGNCGLVTGATYPEELARVRELVGSETILLIPGIGAQGGELGPTIRAGINGNKRGVLVNSSRGIIFASAAEDFAERAGQEARKLSVKIQQYV